MIFKNLLNNISLTFLIFLLDRVSKIYVINLDKKLSRSEIFLSKYLNISLIWNEGIAFGLLSFDQANLYNFLTILIILIIFFIFMMALKSYGLKKIALIMILGGALGNVFDRISKIYVINLDKNFSGSEIFASKYLNISLIWNEGIAFGLFSFGEDNLYNFLTFVIILIISIIFFMTIRSSGIKKFALMMILGGAIGNVFDRIFYKAVPDFIDFHLENFHWFIFNIADVFISLGVLILILFELIGSRKEQKL